MAALFAVSAETVTLLSPSQEDHDRLGALRLERRGPFVFL